MKSVSMYCNEKYIVNCSSKLAPNPSDNASLSLNVEANLLQSWWSNLTVKFKMIQCRILKIIFICFKTFYSSISERSNSRTECTKKALSISNNRCAF